MPGFGKSGIARICALMSIAVSWSGRLLSILPVFPPIVGGAADRPGPTGLARRDRWGRAAAAQPSRPGGACLAAAAGRAICPAMSSRVAFALALGLLGFLLYVGAVVALADHVLRLHWAAQAFYFLAAGVAWVVPARALMFWAARGGGGGRDDGRR